MPILKKEESLPKRPVVIVVYGEPGIGKTSLFNTCESPLLIDFDRGVDRSIMRQDTLLVSKWEDVQVEEKAGTFNAYKTIGIDTAKAALDDFLMSYVIKQDYAAAKNKLKAYGAIGDEFKLFVNNRRADNAELVIIAHAKDEKEGDT
ncbi:MAG: AAA family ATPase, partial [Bacteroidales bacterium]|nr:AAA family ATPase [Bacteroidales bacterium]